MNYMRITFCLYSEKTCQDDKTELNHAFILFSKVLSFPLLTLVRYRQSLYLTLQIGKICHGTLES